MIDKLGQKWYNVTMRFTLYGDNYSLSSERGCEPQAMTALIIREPWESSNVSWGSSFLPLLHLFRVGRRPKKGYGAIHSTTQPTAAKMSYNPFACVIGVGTDNISDGRLADWAKSLVLMFKRDFFAHFFVPCP